jgi:predicted enzyme related to lactoylglutathione lyase
LIRGVGRIYIFEMTRTSPKPLAHLELHTPNLGRASAFYSELLGWRPERIEAGGRSYLALDLGEGPGGGLVECGTERALWLPYVSVPDIRVATNHAEELGATVTLEPREGPAGWRSVIASPDGGEIAFWHSKSWAPDR